MVAGAFRVPMVSKPYIVSSRLGQVMAEVVGARFVGLTNVPRTVTLNAEYKVLSGVSCTASIVLRRSEICFSSPVRITKATATMANMASKASTTNNSTPRRERRVIVIVLSIQPCPN